MDSIFITGVSGQLGSYLAEHYLRLGYKVYGLVRRVSNYNYVNMAGFINDPNFEVVHGDITDYSSLDRPLLLTSPFAVVNCAAQSHVGESFVEPISTAQMTGIGCLNLLEICRKIRGVKYLQLSSSEMFGSNVDQDGRQRETTAFIPNSPYSAAKLFAHNMVDIYRRSYKMWASTAICFNYESPRRSEQFVTRKITKWLADFLVNRATSYTLDSCKYISNIKINSGEKLKLGNINSCRDWTHALDIVNGLSLILNHNDCNDFVLCSGQTRSIQDFLHTTFSLFNLDYRDYILIDEKLFRPCEVSYLKGDYSKAKSILGWEPKITFENLVKDMIKQDIVRIGGNFVL